MPKESESEMQHRDAELSKKFESGLQNLPAFTHDKIRRYWNAFIRQHESSITALLVRDDFLGNLLRVWTCSDFVAQWCVRQPQSALELFHGDELRNELSAEEYLRQVERECEGVQHLSELMACLRRYRNRQMVRIAWRDIVGWADLQTTTEALSSLADACLQIALSTLTQWQNATLATTKTPPAPLLIVALGKLGARELNYSSDIDLMLVYRDDRQCASSSVTSGAYESYYTRIAKLLVQALDQMTEDGFVFRVDLRLRPFGQSGPLVMGFSALENYYISHGRDWERYALIKARLVNTQHDDQEEFMKLLQPFVFRRYLDFGAYQALRDMKQGIAAEVRKRGLQQNIKLGRGGIREIEFIAQAFQLIRGGREALLRKRNLLYTLDRLAELSLLPQFSVDELKCAYRLFRTVEHRLQQFADKQTHILPDNEQQQARLAYAVNYASWTDLHAELQRHRNQVHGYFEQVSESPQLDVSQNDDLSQKLAKLWNDQYSPEQSLHVLKQAGFIEAELIMQDLQKKMHSRLYTALHQEAKKRLAQLMPLVLSIIGQWREDATHKGWAPSQQLLLQRVMTLLEKVLRRSSYLSLLAEHPLALSKLIKLFSASAWLSEHVARYPILLDELLDVRHHMQGMAVEQLINYLHQRLHDIGDANYEQQMDELREFKNAQTFQVAVNDLSGRVEVTEVSAQLANIAEVVCSEALNMVWRHMIDKHGRPSGINQMGFAIIAYGKLGGRELSYTSDLDLVFIYDAKQGGCTQGAKSLEHAMFYSRLAQRFIHTLTALTAAGSAYEVDARLRPSGNSGLLVTHLESFIKYQHEKAWTWEHQALIRARALVGDAQLIARFNQVRQEVLRNKRESSDLLKDIITMREKMREQLSTDDAHEFDIKQGQGGIVDIEFLVQYFVLRSAYQYNGLLAYTDSNRLLSALPKYGLLTSDEALALTRAYRKYRKHVNQLALQLLPAKANASDFAAERSMVTGIWKKYMQA